MSDQPSSERYNENTGLGVLEYNDVLKAFSIFQFTTEAAEKYYVLCSQS